MHDTRQWGHYHIPVCRTNLGKSSLGYFGAQLWNKILNADINPNVSDFIFSRNLKTTISALTITPSHHQNMHDFADGRKNMNDIFNNYVCSASHRRLGLHFQNV